MSERLRVYTQRTARVPGFACLFDDTAGPLPDPPPTSYPYSVLAPFVSAAAGKKGGER